MRSILNTLNRYRFVLIAISVGLFFLIVGNLYAEGAASIIDWDPAPVYQGNLVTFSTASSYDGYKWWISDGPGNPCYYETDTADSTDSTFTYSFYENGDWEICLQVPDETELSGYYTDIQTVTVNNHEPEIGDPLWWTATPEPSNVGQPFHVEVPFMDYEDITAYSCTIDYGDGTESVAGTIQHEWDYLWLCVGPAHTYTTADDFIIVTAIIYDGNPDSYTSEIYYHEVIAPTISLVVNATDDESDGACDATHCSLREAIQYAASGDTITFAANLSGTTITLSSQLTIDKDLTIDGSALNEKVTISGNEQVRVFKVDSGVTATMDSLKIIKGKVYGDPMPFGGGGIYNSGGTLTVANSSLELNEGYFGGGICNNGGTLLVTNSSLKFNTAAVGSGISNHGGSLTITDSNLAFNVADSEGGGIYNGNSGSVSVTNTTLSENVSTYGGGVSNEGSSTTTIIGSTLSGNQATTSLGRGGGLYNKSGGNLAVANSTFSENTAQFQGSGIANFGTLTLFNSTLSGNIGSVTLANIDQGTMHLANTIIANTSGSVDCENISGFGGIGSILTNINNLIMTTDSSTSGSCRPTGGETQYDDDPLLAVLADNDGPTWTMALLAGSPAIDAGDDTICAAAPVSGVDQRGVTRPQGAHCDIGAYEYEGPAWVALMVNTVKDEDDGACDATHCSLREAIKYATSGDTITFAASLSGATITLESQLTLNKNVTIDGSALAEKVTISGNNLVRVFIISSGSVTLDSLVIIDGDAGTSGDSFGGGIFNAGTLLLKNCTLASNWASDGGGISNHDSGMLTVRNSSLEGNTADNGGGIQNGAGTIEVYDTTFSGNTAKIGGGINNKYESGSVFVSGSTFLNNSATDLGGGGISNRGTMSVVNSTFTGNTTKYYGNAIYNDQTGVLTLYNSTLSENSGPFNSSTLYNQIGAKLSLANTIIAHNIGDEIGGGSDCTNNFGTIETNTNNLIMVTDTCRPSEETQLSDDPKLDPLDDNGGPTQTMALLAGSPAIDAGNDSICAVSPVNGVDQRGVTRPQGAHCDIGAYEYGAEPPIVNLPPFAPDYYVTSWGWPSTDPNYSTFMVPVMDPEGYLESISYISPTDHPTEFDVKQLNEGVICFGPNDCWANFYVQALTEDKPAERMYITFQYRVYDGINYSNTATVTLSFGDGLPEAEEGRQLAAKNGTTKFRLGGFGYAPLEFSVVRDPDNGSVGTPAAAVCKPDWEGYYCTSEVDYTPEADFEGWDSFDFVVFDGLAYSHQVDVRLWVAPNSAPTAVGGTATISKTQSSTIVLEATDPDYLMDVPDSWDLYDELTFLIDTPPSNGSLELSYPRCEGIYVEGSDYDVICRSTVLYTPNPGTEATIDSFTFKVNDTHQDSDPATVTLTLRGPTTLTVNSTDDEVDEFGCDETHCSLREAVDGSISEDIIEFDLGQDPAMIVLEYGKIVINKDLTIAGPGADLLTISGGAELNDANPWEHDRVFRVGNEMEMPVYTKISGLTIRDGRASYGGGIFNGYGSTLEMTDCVIGPNNIVTDAGGGIANVGGTLTLNRCTVKDNHGTGSIGGAGIFINNDADTTLINSTVSGNVTNNLGGGILVWSGSTVHLVHSTITGNTANADFAENDWGGGGGIYVLDDGEDRLGGKAYIQNSIVAGNIDVTEPAGDKLPDVYGNFTSWGGNLIGDGTGTSIESWLANDQVGTATEPIDPMLGPLALNAPGSTPTFTLLSGSPAIDAVECAYGVTIDQRGVPRPQGSACDIGAYELEQESTTGSLKITKVFNPLTSGYNSTFEINYSCDDAPENYGTVYLTAGNFMTIMEIPTGTQCTVTEPTLPTAPTGWSFGTPTYSPVTGTVTISGTIAEVTVTNTINRDLGELKISKVFDPLTSGFDGPFTIAYDCDDGETHDGTVNLAAGGTTTISNIPIGTICTVTEPTLPIAPAGWTFGTPTFNPVSGTVTISEKSPAYAEVTVTNTINLEPEVDLSLLTSARTKCSLFASGDAPSFDRLFYTVTSKKGIDSIKSISPATFLYYVKATVPADATSLVISYEHDYPATFPDLGASVTLYDENCIRLSPQLAKVTIDGKTITIDFLPDTAERVIIAAVKYTARPIIGTVVSSPYPMVEYVFSAALNTEVAFTSAKLRLMYTP